MHLPDPHGQRSFVNQTFRYSFFYVDYKDVKKILYVYSKNDRGLHIVYGLSNEKVISQMQSKDEELHQFYIELNERFNAYIAKHQA